MTRTRVVRKWEDEDDEGEKVGPVWVVNLEDESSTPTKSEGWDRWVRRSEAERYAAENRFEFLADE